MAVVQHTTLPIVGDTMRVTWAGLATGDTGSLLVAPEHLFKEVQVLGTFGGSTVTIEGSLDGGTTFATLNDINGTILSFTTARLERVQESVATVRPSVAGGAAVSVTVVMVIKLETR